MAAETIDPNIIYQQSETGRALAFNTFYDELIRVINVNAAAVVAASDPPYVDLALEYGVVPDDSSLAVCQANTAAINDAIADFSGTGACLMLPQGETFVEEFVGNSCIRFGTGVSDLVLAGHGRYSSTLVQFTVGDLGEQDLIVVDGASRIEFRSFGMRQDQITNPDPGQQNHLMCLYNVTAGGVTEDIRGSDLLFGKCIGDALRFVGVNAGEYVDNVRFSDFEMKLNGTVTSTPPNGRVGARSGIAMQRGVSRASFSNFYIFGSQNTPVDHEPTSVHTLESINYENFIIDNTGGSTGTAMSLGGSEDSPSNNERVSNGYVLGGIVTYLGRSSNAKVSGLTVETTEPIASGPTDPLFQVTSSGGSGHTNLELDRISLLRTGTSTAGSCLTVLNRANKTTVTNLTITQGVDGTPVSMQDSPSFSITNGDIRFSGATPASFGAITCQAIDVDCSDMRFNGITVRSSGAAMLHGIRLDQRTPRNMLRLQIRDLNVLDDVTDPVYLSWDTRGGSADKTPEVTGVIASSAITNVVRQVDHNDNPVTDVFPIIGGNRFDICTHYGVVRPEGNVTAVQGSTFVLKGGDQSELWFKETGTFTNTGWKRLVESGSTISPASIGAGPTANYAPTNIDTATTLRQDTSAAAVLSGIQLASYTEGRQLLIVNISANAITLNHEDAASTAANRFSLPGSANLDIAANASQLLRYDATSARWRTVASAGAAAAGTVIITPASLGAGPTNDYSPTGLATATIIQQDTSATAVINGLDSTGFTDDTRIKIDNISSNTITLTHQAAGSLAANRFSLPDFFDVDIPRNSSLHIRYDTASSRWRIDY